MYNCWTCLANFYAIGPICSLLNDQLFKNNLAIWSHWPRDEIGNDLFTSAITAKCNLRLCECGILQSCNTMKTPIQWKRIRFGLESCWRYISRIRADDLSEALRVSLHLPTVRLGMSGYEKLFWRHFWSQWV